jgi:hypothetical protein
VTAVWELAVATLGGAVLGGAGVYVWVRWVVRPKPLRVQHRKVDPAEFARLTKTFGSRHRTSRFVGEHGPELTDIPPGARYTYVRGPIRNRDTDDPA